MTDFMQRICVVLGGLFAYLMVGAAVENFPLPTLFATIFLVSVIF